MLASGVLVGCNHTPSHVDTLPAPTGTLDVLRFETAWSEDALELSQQQWRTVETIIDEGLQRWEGWVDRKWVPFVEDVWEHNDQKWLRDPVAVERLIRRGKTLRRTAARIDAETVARIGMVAGTSKRDAAQLFANQRRLEYAMALATGYGRSGGTPSMPESLLQSDGLSVEAASAMRRVFARTAVARATLLDVLVDLRFEADLAASGENDDARSARKKELRLKLAAAIDAIERANDAAVSEALGFAAADERADLEYEWLRRTSDPDAEFRELRDVAFDIALRLRSTSAARKRSVHAALEEWERADSRLLEGMKSARRARLGVRASGKSRGKFDKEINVLRVKRDKVFWKVFAELENRVDPSDFKQVQAFIRDVPNRSTSLRRLARLVGVADAEAIVASIPPTLFSTVLPSPPTRIIDGTALDLVLREPIPRDVIKGLFLRRGDATLLVVLRLHDDYVAMYAARFAARVEALKLARDRIASPKKSEATHRMVSESVWSFLALADNLRREFAELDASLFGDLKAIGGEQLMRDVLLARNRRTRETADLLLDADSGFLSIFLGPGRVEFATVIEDAGLNEADRFEADSILLDHTGVLLEVREHHRLRSLVAFVSTLSDFQRREINNEPNATQKEYASLVNSVMLPSVVETRRAHEAMSKAFGERLSADGVARMRLGWQLACFPELAFRFAPDLPRGVGEGLARLVAFGRLESRALEAGERAVLDALLEGWLDASTKLLDEAFELRRRTLLSDRQNLRESWPEMFRRYPRFRVLDVRRREQDARTARHVLSLLGRDALTLPWVGRAVQSDVDRTSWALVPR
jgi:hypothetical protein